MDSPRPLLIILADAPGALVELFGVSMVERLLRQLQRIGFPEALILSRTMDAVAAHLQKPSWARADLALTFYPRETEAVLVNDIGVDAERTFIVSAGYYYDARLLNNLASHSTTTLLVDSAPPLDCAQLWRSCRAGASPAPPAASGALALQAAASGALALQAAALIDRDWLARQDRGASVVDQLSADASKGRINVCDAASEPTYVTALRKHVRPVFFPAPTPELIPVAENFVRDLAQNGVLDFPGFLDSPIEDRIVKWLCGTSIRPNQVTFVTMLIGLAVTALFATGRLWWGVALAYAIEVLDGVDGKLARTKVETTTAGEWEHEVDYTIELSWWTALAFHFRASGLTNAYWLLALYVVSDLVDRVAKRAVKLKVGRNLEDVSNFDRFVRCIGARRNVNIWILIAALALGDPVNGFALFCWWGAAGAIAHVCRAIQIRMTMSN